MALSLAELMILCLLVEYLLQRIHVPPLIGMLAVGMVLGPQVLGLLDPDLIRIGSDLRMIALIVILLRAGLELSRESLHKVGLQAVLLAFLPAVFEAALIIALAPSLLSVSRGESVLLACVLAAVSPAVVVPMMVQLIKEGRGTKKAIPTLVLAGASLDDVTVIVAYSIAISLYLGDAVNISWMIASIPLSLVFAIMVGYLIARFLIKVFERYNPRATKRTMALLAIAIALVHIGDLLEAKHIPFAALLAVMAIGFIILEKRESMAHELSSKLGKIWVFAQIVLFAMVGAQVDLHAAKEAGLASILLILVALVGRSVGTYLCTLGSGFNFKEKLFIVISYLPKATVQAAIGSAPLAAMSERGMDTRPGQIILAVAVMSILITAPLGAFAISWGGDHLLSVDETRGSSSHAMEASEAEYDLLKD
ncbi:cation:proton antiporter [Sphaerochaeta halotolerans]|jgi:NhaP-type Na+/H+ or K+/H+ antiporter|uniref:cation:proton antiporter n=1 Tax=Sphaerochaeta halotolerans TaxID=2293840 RepID=UPI00136A27FD|nr:cation:proton antiporter [Sphaerochaeta halotolerans]MBG0767708.1 cation:proton antiporter [Spirochaetaceae bacterium]MXI87473.1 sodium:proton antiporter [Sphaerochaeta halotolerans]